MKYFFLPYSYHGSRYIGISLTCFTILFATLCLVLSGCKEPTTPLEITKGDNFENSRLMKTGFDPNDPLMPTGNSTTDTENLQEALHDVSLDAGGTLYLGPGIFKIHRFIGRQNISDPSDPSYSTVLFNGTIQGSGKNVTILKGVRGPSGDSFEPLHYFGIDDHTLLAVVQTYLGVKDLTFDSESELVDPENLYGTRGLLNFIGTGSFDRPGNELLGTDIVNVHFKGSLDISGQPETALLFNQWGDNGGEHNLIGCEFENSSFGALEFFDIEDATINIGGQPNEKVTLNNCPGGAIIIDGGSNIAINISYNYISNSSGGIYCAFYFPNTQSTLVVEHNDMQNVGKGIDVRDYPLAGGEGKVVDVAVAYNKINLDGTGPYWGGAIYCRFLKDAVIRNNQVTGQVLASAINVRGEGNTLKANNIQNVTSGWEYPQIWLWETSTNNLVIGSGNLSTNVFDEGTDNILVGVNNMHVNIGQDIRNAIANGNFDEINLRKRR